METYATSVRQVQSRGGSDDSSSENEGETTDSEGSVLSVDETSSKDSEISSDSENVIDTIKESRGKSDTSGPAMPGADLTVDIEEPSLGLPNETSDMPALSDSESDSDDEAIASRTRSKVTNAHNQQLNMTKAFVEKHDNERKRRLRHISVTWKDNDWLVQEGKEVGNLPDEALRPDMIEILLENSEMVRQANSTYMEQLAEEGGRSMLPFRNSESME